MLSMKYSIRFLPLAVAALATFAPASGFAATSSASELLVAAKAQAQGQKKNVLVIFHASWCGWCKKLDAMLDSPEFKKTFEKSYVITHVDVLEHADKKDLENAGGAELLAELGGENQGLPFFAVLSPSGAKLGDSMLLNKQNMGYPSAPNEVAAFMTLLKKTAPKMTEADRTQVEAFLRTTK